MQLTTRNKIILVVVYTAIAVAAGRYMTPEKVKVETKIVEVEKKTDDKDVAKEDVKHKHIVVTQDSKPSGETIVTTDTTYDDKDSEDSKEIKTDTSSKDEAVVKETVYNNGRVTLSALGGINLSTLAPVYGASIVKPIVGPVAVGIWGLSDGSCGVSVGLQF
jgi:hypothetical protein